MHSRESPGMGQVALAYTLLSDEFQTCLAKT